MEQILKHHFPFFSQTSFWVYTLYIRNHFNRNLLVEGRKIKISTFESKSLRNFFNFKYYYHCEQSRIRTMALFICNQKTNELCLSVRLHFIRRCQWHTLKFFLAVCAFGIVFYLATIRSKIQIFEVFLHLFIFMSLNVRLK